MERMRCASALTLAVLVLILTGCGKTVVPDLPEDAVAFRMGTFSDPEDDDALYGTIEFEGRTYIGFGVPGKSLKKRDIDRCVGYILRDWHSSSVPDPDDTSRRICTLSADPGHNYLLEYDVSGAIMEQPSFWRALDSQGLDIPTPDYIDSLAYPFWERG